MDIGIPRERRESEYRVGLTPIGVQLLTAEGHTCYIERHAGVGAGFTSLQMTNLAGVTVGDGSATVPTWMLRAALLYAVSDSIWVGPYVAYFAINKWNANLPAVAVGTREALLIGAVITIGMKLF